MKFNNLLIFYANQRFIDHIEQFATPASRSTIDPYYQKVILSIFSKLNQTTAGISDHEIKYAKYILKYGIFDSI